MTDLNKSNPKNTHTDSAAEQQMANSQQVSVKAWSQKLLVVLLCLASFYGGWKSYESNMINECTANGGQMIEGQRTMLCQLS
ncbi:hypothetical protein [Psychrobacter sp. DAB_AL43B]|uniref:hypothetical protein n=1 Tax=Psychrobacter sp. DAB_AL43B TaxID=1028416 RepID=UPI0009A6C93D|nr:hypothetical protein [Psychrobacter sp. DAB_AL43B]SLJ85192.1 hypothetical protein DABAL43B_2001 [Psychrobacter sp. DAB_AL43B]